MIYELRHFNTPILRFTATEDSSTPEIEILWVNEDKNTLLPLDLNLSGEGLAKWLKHRTIPKNRAYVNNFLSKCGLHLNRPMNIIKVSKGLSLNDCYWVVEEGFEGSFEKYNLYDNRFSKVLALIAFTGYGSSIRTSLASCPEFTTNGMLPKCWRRIDGAIKLYKGGTTGGYNTGNEPYSEFYVAQVAEKLGFEHVEYGLSKWNGELCSTCELFTSKKYSFMPIGRIVTSGGMKAVRAYYKELGEDYVSALNDMLVLDAVICNTDRHLGNFGFLIDNETNKIAAPAPLFDHGNALFNYAGHDDLESLENLSTYAETLLPCVYDDFIGTAKEVLTPKHREELRHLMNFKLKKHSRYNLPDKRLKLIEKMIQKRAQMLLDK
ncbi:MAG: XRE family transcriptional regulator [Clostridiales bacterium]|nr:XRE family transcriptional regulator [Clostridiales bacterium]MCI7618731.1 XRE family transcriptional regulator [Bacillota bacterium]MDD7034721.1 XRE family transcriptional regulator [Bacillota bacterium]MDY2919651.1 XRE family transcriptional regulator [Lentihominibacter sp.]